MNNSFVFEGIGTRWEVEVYSPISPVQFEYLQTKIKQRVEGFEQTYSRFRPDSFINSSLLQIGEIKLPPDSEKLFTLYRKLYKMSDGLFTPLIGQILIDAGYDAEYSLKPKELHSPPSWDEISDYHYPYIHNKKSAVYDFGAAGKGHLIDLVAELISEEGFPEFCIDAGRDILLSNSKPIRIGLENPLNLQEAIGVVTMNKGSICASAGSRRSWGPYHHIINPKTLTSPQKILATWVIAEHAIVADALSTCLFLMPPQKLVKQFSFEYLTVFYDNTFEKSSSFPAELFLK